MVSPELERARLLLAQGRHKEAESEIRRLLASDPHDADALIVLAISLDRQQKSTQALDVAKAAIAQAPQSPLAHYALAQVYYSLSRWQDAHAAIAEAIEIDPMDADYHSLQSAIFLVQRNWQEALAAAMRGLQCDPEHVHSANLRAIALNQLGRQDEAGLTIDETLRREPENATAHANKGWTLLHENRPDQALLSFRQALRLEPDHEWARDGMLEAMRASYFIYRQMLKYYLFMSRLSGGAQWALIIGFYVLYRMLLGLGKSNPELKPFILPVLIVYILFVFLSWIAKPLFNLALFVHPFGRLALNSAERLQARGVGINLSMVVGLLAAGYYYSYVRLFILGVVTLLFVIPLSNVLDPDHKQLRGMRIAAALLLAAMGIAGALVDPYWLSLYSLGILVFTIFAGAAR